MKRVISVCMVLLLVLPVLTVSAFASEPVNDALYFDFVSGNYPVYELGVDGGGKVRFFHLSDVVLEEKDFSNGLSCYIYSGDPLEFDGFYRPADRISEVLIFYDEGFGVIADVFFIIPYDNFTLDGILFPKAGLFCSSEFCSEGLLSVTLDFHGARTFDSENTFFFMQSPDGVLISYDVMTPGEYRVFVSPDGGPLFTISQNVTFSLETYEDGSQSLVSGPITDYMAFPIPSLGSEAASDGSPLLFGFTPIATEGTMGAMVFADESGDPADTIPLSEGGYLLLEKIEVESDETLGVLSSVITPDFLAGILNDLVSLLPLLIPVMIAYIGIRKGVRWLSSVLRSA